jgi:hypothetical protein
MSLLGHILSLKAGKSYEQLISDSILRKLSMQNTASSLTPEMQKMFATGHHLGKPVGYWDFTPATMGCGGLRSNVKDMAQFLAANMGLSNSPMTDLLKECHQQQYTPIPTVGVGFGWMLSCPSSNTKIIMHNGGTGGFRTYLGFNPSIQRGIVILTNSTEDWPDELGSIALNPAFKKPLIDKSLANDPDYLNKFVGSYDANVFVVSDLPKQTIQIRVFGKQLASSMTCGEIGMLYPESMGVFGIKGFPDGKIRFSFDENGHVTKVQAVLLSSGTTTWEAVPAKEKIN